MTSGPEGEPKGWRDPVRLMLSGEECCAVFEALGTALSYTREGSLHYINTKAVRERLWALRQATEPLDG